MGGNAQGISVSFSIEWEPVGACEPLTNEQDSIPFLCIAYSNLTDTAFYFSSISREVGLCCPEIGPEELVYLSAPINLEHNIKGTRRQDTVLYDIPLRGSLWAEGRGLFYFANCIESVHSAYLSKRHLKTNDSRNIFTKVFWTEENMTPEAFELYDSFLDSSLEMDEIRDPQKRHIIQNFSNALVFLRPYEAVVQSRCLIGFWYMGGNYRFFLENGFKPEPGAIAFVPYKSHFVPFPETLHGYTLYKGQIKAENDVLLLLNKDN